MSVLFDYYDKVQNAYNLVTGGAYSSRAITNPNNDVFYQALFNPGHEGTAEWLDYYFYWQWYSDSISASITWTWQYKPKGGAWTDLVSGQSSMGGSHNVNATATGIIVASISMPVELRLIGTDPDAVWQVSAIGGDSYKCVMRAVGTVG